MESGTRARTRSFALSVIKLAACLPRRFEIQHIQGQLLRASSSVAANFRAAFRGRLKAEFVAKLGLAEEECDESQFWLEMLRDAYRELNVKLTPPAENELNELIGEANQLLRIIIASKKTVRVAPARK